ncbi:MAG TPA: lysine-sensitive aspartokinase 3, partial [Thermoanaerobaculia bacterium]|nr:lysine-sensitive aspartokinase 3 [Thermoanaerobaculia bacterium]
MIIIKFGGTSVGDAQRVANAIDIVAARREQKPIVVVSALSGVTNELVAASEAAQACDGERVDQIIAAVRRRHEDVAVQLVQQKLDFFEAFTRQLDKQIEQIHTILRGITLLGEITPRARDKVMSIGEKLSSVLFAYSMMMRAVPGEHVHSEDVVITDTRFGEATPLMDETREAARRSLLPLIERNLIPVMGGFIGRTRDGATTTLGRGGSDYSAAIVGAALGAEEIQIWTDVDGMMTCDPRLIPGARIIDSISYVEAAELAWFGAKVLHPRTIAPAVERNIPVRVLNTHNVSSPGTLITRDGDERHHGPRAIALKKGITVLHMTSSKMLGAYGFLARLFAIFEQLEVAVDLITTSEISVSVTIDEKHNLSQLVERLAPVAGVEVRDNQCIVAVVGRNLMKDSEVGARVFEALRGVPMSMLALGTSGLNLSIVVEEKDAERAVKSIHHALFETTEPSPAPRE